MATLKIIKFDKVYNEHLCLDGKGDTHKVDLWVSGDLQLPQGKDYEEYMEEMVGKIIECRLIPFKEIAMDIKILGTSQVL